MNCLRNKIKHNKPAIGSWINSGSGIIAEAMSKCGYDFLTIDVEHSAVDLTSSQAIFQSIRSGNPHCSCLARLSNNHYSDVKRFMDIGADGVIVPLINSPAQVKEVIDAVKYPPTGRRGLGFCRANDYGLSMKGYCETSNEESLIIIQVEHIDGVNAIEDILSVGNIDGVFIGPYDLSASLGIPGNFDVPPIIEAIETIKAACSKFNVPVGTHVIEPEQENLARAIAEGYKIIAFSLDITILTHVSKNNLKSIKDQ